MDGSLPRRKPASHPITNNPSTANAGAEYPIYCKASCAIFSHSTSIRRTKQGIIRMQDHISTIYFSGHVGPFSVYPTAAYAMTVATSCYKLTMPKWRNNILKQIPDAPDDNAVAALLTTVAQHGRTILLFADHATFKAWQLLLAQVQA
jgi:hypothetical protein